MRYVILALFTLITSRLFSQETLLDSLYSVLKNHPERDTTRVLTLIQVCYHEYALYPEKNKTHAEEILSISNDLKYTKGKGRAYRYIAAYYWMKGDHGQAIENAFNMLREFESISASGGMGQAYQLLGTLYEEENDFKKASLYYNKALNIYQDKNLKRDIGYCYNSLGTLYVNFSKLDTALLYFQSSMKVRKEIHDDEGLGQSYGNLAEVYSKQQKFTEAIHYFDSALLINLPLDNYYQIASNYKGLGELYIYQKNYKKAESYLLKAVDLAKIIKQKKILKETYDMLTRLEKNRGAFDRALTFFELATLYSDSIYTEEKSKQIADVETRYETEKKDQTIQLLEKEKHIQMLWTNILIATFVILAGLSIVAYFLERYRERKNRLILNLEIENLTTQNKELSDRFKGILTAGDGKSAESLDQRLLKKAIEIVENHMSDSLFGVEKMAKEMGMSRTNMHRKIKAITGFPPSELIRSIRLRKAAMLLLNQADTVSQISMAVGFEDHSYFSKAFKKQFGVSPSEYFQSVTPDEPKRYGT
jgi:AraC-like DNA-binding protein/Tfp pilus assembly protein PilF